MHGRYFLALVVVALALHQTGWVTSSPVAEIPSKEDTALEKESDYDFVLVIFSDSCGKSGEGEREFQISRKKDCIDVDLNESHNKVRTKPDGLRIHLFAKENCQEEINLQKDDRRKIASMMLAGRA